jgi:2-polyprenyl-3-methyl-5-hydroxy-6-metoxy-1,4-benzoquinol methylase
MQITRPHFESDYWPVDMEKLRPSNAYGKMKRIRAERMQVYQGSDGSVRPELLEERACPVCGAQDQTPLFRKEGYQFVTCGKCSLIFVAPSLKMEHLRELYAHQSYSDIVKALMDESNVYRRERFGSERVAIINKWSPQAAGPRRLLDVGCATGFFLEAAKAAGWDVYGVEANPYAVDYARKNGLDVRNEMIEDTTFAPGTFDAITLFEVIEHVHEPMAILRKVRDLLRPGGVAYVYTPNFDCAERLIMGQEAHFIWGSNHLQYFTPETMATAFQRAGYEVLHWETQGLDIEDVLWHFENTGEYDVAFLKAYRHQLQFVCNAGGWGKNLRMYARRPA